MRFVSRSVMTGFVNALAILIFLAQMPELIGATPVTYVIVAAGLAIICLLPLVTEAVPSPLVAIVLLTAAPIAFGPDVRMVGDMGQLPTDLPAFLPPDAPLALVGLLESLMAAQIVDEFTDTASDKNREATGQGIANIVSALFGGTAGCAMIGQSVINVKSGRARAAFHALGGAVPAVPDPGAGRPRAADPDGALVAVMVMVSIGTFRWSSRAELRPHPKSSTAIMLATVAVTMHDLAQGVLVGVLLSGIFFARKVARLFHIRSRLSPGGMLRTYTVTGEVFFASAGPSWRPSTCEAVQRVVIDVSGAHVWDLTAVAALDRVVLKFRHAGTEVQIPGMNEASATLVERLAVHDKPGVPVRQPRAPVRRRGLRASARPSARRRAGGRRGRRPPRSDPA